MTFRNHKRIRLLFVGRFEGFAVLLPSHFGALVVDLALEQDRFLLVGLHAQQCLGKFVRELCVTSQTSEYITTE